MAFRGVALVMCFGCLLPFTLEQSSQQEDGKKDVLLESDSANSSAIEELRKKIDEIVQELRVLKEVQALHYELKKFSRAIPEGDAKVCLKGVQVPGKCFLANPGKKSFYDAHNDCVLQGGTLSTPLTDEENHQLHAYARQKFGSQEHIWLGITDVVKEGEWVDKTGNGIRFQNWERQITHQPLGGRALNCAIMSNGKWFDESCRAEKAFVCEFSII